MCHLVRCSGDQKMNTYWLLILFLNKGYGQYDIMFQEFTSENSCIQATNIIKSMKHDDILTSCIHR